MISGKYRGGEAKKPEPGHFNSHHPPELAKGAQPLHTSETNPKSPTLSHLSRFVGHFWGKPRRSFASVVKNPRAPTTVVKMQPRGAGRRGGVASRGTGRRSARENVWRRVEEGSSSAHRQEADPTDEEKMKGEEPHQQNPWEQQRKSPEGKSGIDWEACC